MALADEYPDVQAIVGDKSATLSNIEHKLELVIKSGKLDGEALPHPFMDLQLAKQIALGRLNALETDGAPSDVLLAVRQWIAQVDEEIANITPPPTPGVGPDGQPLPKGPPPTPLTGAPRLPAAEQAIV